MDKSAIKTFAVESRRQMIESVKYQASLIGITAEGISEPISKAEGMETYDYGAGTHSIYDEDIQKRKSLVKEIENKGFENVVEEVAYTWFNRIIAIRYMEVNDYLPTRTRVFSSELEGKIEPDFITEALELDLDYTLENKELIFKLKEENKLDELFRFLFIKQCNKLNEILPGLFKTTDDYFDLLLNISFTNETGVIRQLINSISEDDFKNQIEIIGWLYQYYISEKKDQVININKSNIKKRDIPAATQLFTTDWVVKYMVDNSLGKYWIERNPNSNLKNFLEYYLDEVEQNEGTQNKLNEIRSEQININDLTFFDPCMGSGHILVYAFDVFFEIYKELGYLESDIPELILKNNIFGLDIDDRAYQLAYFAVLMKARKYDRKILIKSITPNVYAIQESINITGEVIEFIRMYDGYIANDVIYLKELFESGKEFGSLIQVTKNIDVDNLRISLNDMIDKSKSKLTDIVIKQAIETDLLDLINQAELLSKKYSVIVTNPPYMNKFEKNLKDFAKKYYKNYSKDLFSMFIYRNFDFCKKYGYVAFMTPFVWMFIKNYENLRKFIINNKNISSLIQLEYSAFSEAIVPICTFVLINDNMDYIGKYIKLSEFPGNMDVQKEKVLDAINNPNLNYVFNYNIKKSLNVPGSPISYWINKNIIDAFSNGIKLHEISDIKVGLQTSDNNRFLRFWYEVNFNNIGFNVLNSDNAKESCLKWFPHNKGGSFRKWYGNQDYVVNWYNDGFEIKNFRDNNGKLKSRPQNTPFYFKESISWSEVSSSKVSFRFYETGFVFDSTGCSLFAKNIDKYYLLGFLNSSINQYILNLISPTMHYTTGAVSSIPIINNNDIDYVKKIVKENIESCKKDWDDYETSWNFKKHPLLTFKGNKIKENFDNWRIVKERQFNLLKNNEILLDQFFSKVYSTNLDTPISNQHISIQQADYELDIKSFISFSIGCIFGRYSLDNEGLQFAGGEFDINNYNKFIPDDDNIIPVLDTEYFEDDIVGRFVEFVKVCFGEETLEENLDFIAGALNKKGNTSREIIRNYFLNDFFKNHVKIYKKRPIYWQFDSGKQNAFKCIIYVHRYEPDIVARVRTDYLHKTQKAIEQNLAHCDNIISNSSNKSEISKATKDKSKYIKQLEEIKVYDEALRHLATQNIEIDLDDGVKVNYAKFQNVEISKEGEKTKKVNLLKKI